MLTRNKRRQADKEIPDLSLPDTVQKKDKKTERNKKQKKTIAAIAAVVEPILMEVAAPLETSSPAKTLPRFEKRPRPPEGFYNHLEGQLDLEKTLEKYVEEHKDLDDEKEYNPDEEHINLFTVKEREYLKTLDPQERIKLFKIQDELRALTPNIPQKIRIMLMPIPLIIKDEILKKVTLLETTDASSADYMRTQKWVDDVLRIPFGKYRELPLRYDDTLTDPISVKAQEANVSAYLKKCRDGMDDSIYGQPEIKEVCVDFIAKKIRNPRAQGKCLAFEGPAGVGKTTFGRQIAKDLGKEFIFISLGGANHGSLLDGDQEKWVGSRRGAILDGLIRTQTMDPVIMFDEVDKVSGSEFGTEITNVLTCVTDPVQNKEFYDKQFIDIPLDLSNVTWVFSFNFRDKVPPILRDRMDIRTFREYSYIDRVRIAQKHIVPTVINDIGMRPGKVVQCESRNAEGKVINTWYEFVSSEVIISEEIVKYLICHRSDDEKGMRTIRRLIESICEKANRLIMEGKCKEKPIRITPQFIDDYIPRGPIPIHLTYIK